MTDPFKTFENWYDEHVKRTNEVIPSACCLSTLGTDGFPNARFVSLKQVRNDCFVVTGPLESQKGIELKAYPRAALTFWWSSIGKQVRIQGDTRTVNSSEADLFFSERSRESQIISLISEQGKPLDNMETLENRFRKIHEMYKEQQIPRPTNWGGFEIHPIRIEFLEFKTNRFHKRILYILKNGHWQKEWIQP